MSHDDRVTVWIRDDFTGEVRCSDEQGEHSTGYRFSSWWWAEGNGSCDCNREHYFGHDAVEAGTAEEGICLGAVRYVIVRVEPMPEGMTVADFNQDYVRKEG